jgi:hypothetical protein
MLLACCSFQSCRNDNIQANKRHITFTDSIKNDSSSFIVKSDTSFFTNQFIKEIKDLTLKGGFHRTELYDRFITLDKDTVDFPNEFIPNKLYHFQKSQTDFTYHLITKKLNEVLLQYHAVIVSLHDTLFNQTGYVELNPGFIFAVELEEDEETMCSFSASEYSDKTNNFSIKISRIDTPIKALWKIRRNDTFRFKGSSPTLKINTSAMQ